jgi:hypothetical protein
MSRKKRFPCVLSVPIPENMAAALESLSADGLLTTSDHARQALQRYLVQVGALTIAPRPNGQHQPQEAA